MIKPIKCSGLCGPLGLTLAAALTVVLTSAAAPAATAQSLGREMVRVPTSDLDTATASGAGQLLHRIRMASAKACAEQGSDPVYATGGYFGCVRRTTADAVARADIPRLTALYRGRTDTVLARAR
jgi:UrcA family protein